MRCNYCGMQNDDNATTCSKCGRPLQHGRNQIQGGHQPSVLPHRPTVLEPGAKDVDLDLQNDFPTTSEPQQMTNCPKCTYPLQPGASECPNCGTPVASKPSPGSEQVRPHQPTVINSIASNNPQPQPLSDTGITFNTDGPQATNTDNPASKASRGGTVYFYDNPLGLLQNEFSLTPLKRTNEKHDFSPLNFEGDEVELNRNNLEHNNMSITSSTQAVISSEDGKFFITDKSDFRSTFVQAKDRIEIKDGDIILMGNRMFEFHA